MKEGPLSFSKLIIIIIIRRMLKSLSDDQYQDIMVFCEAFPHITMKAEVEGMLILSFIFTLTSVSLSLVPDDEDTKTITIGSLVNVSVQLVREGLLVSCTHSNTNLCVSFSCCGGLTKLSDSDLNWLAPTVTL